MALMGCDEPPIAMVLHAGLDGVERRSCDLLAVVVRNEESEYSWSEDGPTRRSDSRCVHWRTEY